jgi:hypothetical protein
VLCAGIKVLASIMASIAVKDARVSSSELYKGTWCTYVKKMACVTLTKQHVIIVSIVDTKDVLKLA